MNIGDLKKQDIKMDLKIIVDLKKQILEEDTLSSPTTERIIGALTGISIELSKELFRVMQEEDESEYDALTPFFKDKINRVKSDTYGK